MVWFIAKKEFRNNIVTPSFIAGLLLCLVLIPYTVYTGIQSYENRLARYELDIKAANTAYDNAPSYGSIEPLLVKPLSSLSIFCDGILEQTGSKVLIDKKQKPAFSSDIVSIEENPFMSAFMSLDFTMALAILLSLLGILFSYDMLSREKEQGTLKLALSHPVSRSTFFIGKIAGIFLTLLPILVICFLVVLLIIQFSPAVRFSAGDYGRIVALLLLSLVYFGFFVFLGGFISSRTKSSTSSIILNLFIWCFLLFLLPSAAAYLGKNITPASDYKQVEYNITEIDMTWWYKHSQEIQSKLKEEFSGTEGSVYNIGLKWNYDGPQLIVSHAPKRTMEYERRRKELSNPILLKLCDDKWALQSEYLQKLYRQEKTVRYLSCLSPAGIFKYISALLCRTGLDSDVHFMNQARQFHDIYFGYFVQNRIFASYSYFTAADESTFTDDEEELKIRAEQFKKNNPGRDIYHETLGTVDTGNLPRFTYTQLTLEKELLTHLWLVAGILIACILLFWLSYVSFIKYDVR
jgi:ABC-type transport system involved in multi-copper enzyme maturation permease subunit